MWIFLAEPPCFLSVVQKPGDEDLTIRSRVRADLEAFSDLCPMTPIAHTPGADYQYRAKASHEDFAKALAAAALELDYPNFKQAITRRLGLGREAIYHRVWSLLLRELVDAEAGRVPPSFIRDLELDLDLEAVGGPPDDLDAGEPKRKARRNARKARPKKR